MIDVRGRIKRGIKHLVIAAVAHQTYRQMSAESVEALLSPKGTLADIKGIWRNLELDGSIDRWSL